MIIASDDDKRIVDIESGTLYSLFSTAEVRLGGLRRKVPLALKFLESGECESQYCGDAARQVNLIHDGLSNIAPEEAVFDIDDRKKEVPWKGNISGAITSCANLYTTSDGKDLLFELVSVLVYADIKKQSVHAH